MSVMLDKELLFRRIRRWVPSGLGCMGTGTILYQMGGKPGVDPYGWPIEQALGAKDLHHPGDSR